MVIEESDGASWDVLLPAWRSWGVVKIGDCALFDMAVAWSTQATCTKSELGIQEDWGVSCDINLGRLPVLSILW